MRRTVLSTSPVRRIVLGAVIATLLAGAGCTKEAPTTIGAPVLTASAPTGSATATATAPDRHATTAAGRPGTGGPTPTATPGTSPATHGPAPAPVRAPRAYHRVTMGIPQLRIGYADVESSVPVGWPVEASVPPPSAQLYGNATGRYDRTDPSGALLVRIGHEPARQPTADASLAELVDRDRAVPGTTVTVTAAGHTDPMGLWQAEWTVDLLVAGHRRHALVSGWVLNDQIITVYVSAPAGSEGVARILYAHATDLRITTHSEPEAG